MKDSTTINGIEFRKPKTGAEAQHIQFFAESGYDVNPDQMYLCHSETVDANLCSAITELWKNRPSIRTNCPSSNPLKFYTCTTLKR